MQENADSVPNEGLPSFVADPLGVLRRRWRWMILVLALGSIAAAGVVSAWPERYEATAKLRLSGQRIPENFVRSTLLESLEEQLNEMVSEVLSRSQLTELVEELQLDRHEGTEGLLSEVRESLTVEPETTIPGRGTGGNSLVIAVRYESDDPETAATVANALADRFITVHIKRRAQQTRITSDFLRQEMERAEQALHEQRSRVAEFKQRHRGELPSEQGAAISRLERLQQERQSLATQISEAEGRLLLLKSQEGPADDRLLAELRDRLAAERTVHTEEHPNVAALRAQVEALEAEVSAADSGPSPQDRAPVVIVRREIESLRAQLAAADREMIELDARVNRIPAREEELAALQQREEVLQESYVQALRKVKEAELAESLEQAQQGFRISRLERAMPPTQPTPPRWQLAAEAGAAVIAATLALGFLLEWFDRVVVEARDLEALTGMMNLGEVPKMS